MTKTKTKRAKTMTSKKREEIRAWLRGRIEIYQKYANELKAVQSASNQSVWMVPDDKGYKKLTDSEAMNTDTARALIVNHAYYQGAVDALYGFGILVG